MKKGLDAEIERRLSDSDKLRKQAAKDIADIWAAAYNAGVNDLRNKFMLWWRTETAEDDSTQPDDAIKRIAKTLQIM